MMAMSPVVSTAAMPIALVGVALTLLCLFYFMYQHSKSEQQKDEALSASATAVDAANAERDAALARTAELEEYFKAQGYGDLEENRARIEQENADFRKDMEVQCAEYERQLAEANAQQEAILQERTALAMGLEREIAALEERRDRAIEVVQKTEDAERRYGTLKLKLQKAKKNLEVIEHCVTNWMKFGNLPIEVVQAEDAILDQNSLDPIAEPNLKAMTVPDLRKEAKSLSKAIDDLCDEFSMKFQQKTVRSLFAAVVLYVKLELRGILEELRYKEQDEAIKKVRHLMFRVQDMLSDGSKKILPAFLVFLGEMEKLGMEAVKVEYLWYLRKEQQRQEQAAIRERMREEREERMRMEEERKRIAEEEEKYAMEVQRLRQKLEEEKVRAAQEAERTGVEPPAMTEVQQEIESQLLKVETNLGEVAVKKEEIAKLQNGKAGTVYVISNLGSFGEDVFKVGMTRRLNPQDRVDELGDASVPFEFDVHSFIFSEDASGLEAALHQRLSEMRLNKINPRKEFFRVSLDEIERIVQETDPTAEFNRTMVAEEYRASVNGVVLEELSEVSQGDATQISEEDSE